MRNILTEVARVIRALDLSVAFLVPYTRVRLLMAVSEDEGLLRATLACGGDFAWATNYLASLHAMKYSRRGACYE